MKARYLAPAALLLSLAGCGGGETASKKELLVLCGSSFVPPTEALCERFTAETGVAVDFAVAGSEDFLPQIKTARRGDVLITHDPYLDYVREAGALAGHVPVGFVAPVLAVQKGNPKGLTRLEDLGNPGLKVALSDPKYSTCGEMVAGLLEAKGIKDAVMRNVENRLTKGHGRLGTLVKTRAVDAVVMWNGVANTFRESLDVVRTPYEYSEEIRVHVIGLNHSKNPELVKKLIALAGTQGEKIFAQHGYVK